jgi:hypothetical protein
VSFWPHLPVSTNSASRTRTRITAPHAPTYINLCEEKTLQNKKDSLSHFSPLSLSRCAEAEALVFLVAVCFAATTEKRQGSDHRGPLLIQGDFPCLLWISSFTCLGNSPSFFSFHFFSSDCVLASDRGPVIQFRALDSRTVASISI